VKDLFAYDEHTDCATHDMLACEHCGATVPSGEDQGMQAPDIAEVLEDDLLTWQHHRGTNAVSDTLLQEASRKLGSVGTPTAPRVSFTMTCTVEFTPEHIAKLEEEDQAAEQQRNKPEKAACDEMETTVAPDMAKPTLALAEQQRSKSEKSANEDMNGNSAPDMAKPIAAASAEQQWKESDKAGTVDMEAAVAPDLAKPAASASAHSHASACPSSSSIPASAKPHAAEKQSSSLLPAPTNVCTKAKPSNSSMSAKPKIPIPLLTPSIADEILDLPVLERESEVKSTTAAQAASATMDDAILDIPVLGEDVTKTRAATPTIIDEIIDSPVDLVEEHTDAPPNKMRRLSPFGNMHEFDLSSVIAVAEDTCDW